MHLPLHAYSPLGQLVTHAPLEHAVPDGQTFPHVPQLSGSVLLFVQNAIPAPVVQASGVVAGHAQVAFEHC
jgi:hypothetical protein